MRFRAKISNKMFDTEGQKFTLLIPSVSEAVKDNHMYIYIYTLSKFTGKA